MGFLLNKSICLKLSDGTKHWIDEQGRLHREDGPALEHSSGDKRWFYNGKLHRLDGHAVEHADGRKEYWINYQNFEEQNFAKAITMYLLNCDAETAELTLEQIKDTI
jgi:hypothetical protein